MVPVAQFEMIHVEASSIVNATIEFVTPCRVRIESRPITNCGVLRLLRSCPEVVSVLESDVG